ncbi:hypothetical protein ACI6QG_03345 [Roseococcus sp. DSY-14]|uniref:hypothetical protein n=1 Tax=Roseococcus sp. DSY-14 TaxID=3369650 RepID=UPI00387B8B00
MGASFATERRLLSEEEVGFVRRSHMPALAALTPEEALETARWLRERHARAQGKVRDLRRARRGKSPGDGAPSERGLAAKKQVFARALKRLNGKLGA